MNLLALPSSDGDGRTKLKVFMMFLLLPIVVVPSAVYAEIHDGQQKLSVRNLEVDCKDSKEYFGASNKMTCNKLRKLEPSIIDERCKKERYVKFCPLTCGPEYGG